MNLPDHLPQISSSKENLFLDPANFVPIDDHMETRTIADMKHHANTEKIYMSMKLEVQIHFVSYMIRHARGKGLTLYTYFKSCYNA